MSPQVKLQAMIKILHDSSPSVGTSSEEIRLLAVLGTQFSFTLNWDIWGCWEVPPLCHGGKTQQDPVPELEAMLSPPLPWSFGSMLPEVGFYLQKKLTRYFWLQVKEKKKIICFSSMPHRAENLRHYCKWKSGFVTNESLLACENNHSV